jgi:hypothetical protein
MFNVDLDLVTLTFRSCVEDVEVGKAAEFAQASEVVPSRALRTAVGRGESIYSRVNESVID